MPAYIVYLPMTYDSNEVGNLKMIRDYHTLIKQNLKNLVLTNPGERIMDPNFGVGIKTLLFEQKHAYVRDEIIARINNQVTKYMPFIVVEAVLFENSPEFLGETENESNYLGVKLVYRISALDETGIVSIDVSEEGSP